MVAIDGLDWRVIHRLTAEGRLPNIARMIDEGISGDLETIEPAYSPVIWATVATGKHEWEHGITGFFTRRGPSADRVSFTSNLRRSKVLWNILSEVGRQVAVFGWWTTWPAEPVSGVMVSDRMLYNRFNLWFGVDRTGADLPAQTHPPELFDRLLPLAQGTAAIESEFFDRFAPDGPRPRMERHLHDPWFELLMVYARDRAYGEMLDVVLQEGDYHLVAHYLNGPDIASHYFWKYLFPEEWDEPLPAEDLRRYGPVIERYYEFVDDAIAPLLAQASPQCVVILLSDHGFVTGRRDDSPAISGTHYLQAPAGVLVMRGGGLPGGSRFATASVADVTPTVLRLLGHAPAEDMSGRVLAEVSAVLPASTATAVESYEDGRRSGAGVPLQSVYDEAILEKLRALGYIGSGD